MWPETRYAILGNQKFSAVITDNFLTVLSKSEQDIGVIRLELSAWNLQQAEIYSNVTVIISFSKKSVVKAEIPVTVRSKKLIAAQIEDFE